MTSHPPPSPLLAPGPAAPSEPPPTLPPSLCFGPYELRPHERQLLLNGQPAALGARAFDVLLALVQHRHRVLAKSELLDLAWPGLVVEENNLSVQISALRKVLGPQRIATIPSLGYRFAAAIDEARTAGPAVPAAPHSPTVPPVPRDACVMCVQRADGPLDAAQREADWAAIDAQHGRPHSASAPGQWLAVFANASDAAACAHALHQQAIEQQGDGAAASDLRIGLHREAQLQGIGLGDKGSRGDPARTVQRLVGLVPPGETWASAEVVGEFIHTLDGDLQDLGHQHVPDADAPIRVFRLTTPAADQPRHDPQPTATNLLPTLAVVPFSGYLREEGSVVLGDIIADQVIGTLSRSRAINVISRLSTLAFRDRNNPVSQIARCLAADFIVSGRYYVASGKVQVHVELADAASSRVLWTDNIVDSELAALQPDSQLVQSIVGGITQAVFVHQVHALRTMPLPNLASHTLMLAAINLLYRLAPRDFGLAREALQTVIDRAPRHAAPLAWLARWHLFRVVQGWSEDRDTDGRVALDLAQRALDLDPDSSLALTMLGNVHTSYLKDLDRADSLYDQALDSNPNESLAWLQKGNARSFRGDGAAALAHALKASSLSPLDPSRHYYLSILASAALSAQDFEKAIEAARQSLRLNHEHVSTHRVLSIALAMSGRLEEARVSLRHLLRLEPQLTVAAYVARSPGAQSGLAQTFGQALHAAGLPLGTD